MNKLEEPFSIQSKVSIHLICDHAFSNFVLLNSEDLFNIKAKDLGKLSKIKIGHDNTGGGPAWYLDKVSVI